MYVLSLLFTPFCLAAIPENDCTIYTYESLKEKPIAVENNTRGTCPQGGGSRAFFNGPTTNESHRHDPRAMKEIMPLPNQTFKCLPNRRCEMLIQGLGIGVKDNLILTTSSCPPLKESLQQTTLAQATRTIPMFQGNPDGIAFALFELPERHLLEPGIYNVCYAPALANDGALIDYLDSKDFHYTAGTLELGEGLFQCTFEEDYTTAADDSVLPCGFKNFWDAYHIDLTWSLNSNSTETPDTGPSGDSTPGLRGQGHYALLESPGYSFGATGTLVSSPISFPTGVFCVSFKYHMYGKDVASLRVYMHNVGGDFSALNGEWGSPSWVAVGNKGNIWHHGGFELHPASDLSSYQIVIEGVAGKSEMGDLGIDDVFVTAGHCPVDIRHNQPKTISNDDSPMICGEVRLNTGSNPRDKSWHVENSISCAGRGYTLADVATPTWLPCCVPHFGTYKLILEDSMGDGWTGSELEFRFFDKVVKYGKSDDFTRTGYNKAYDIIIGMVEILEVKKPSSTKADVSVRIARANSYAWCGVVQTSKDGKALDIKVDDSVLKTYGIRSENPTTKENEVKHIIIDKVLRENALYDVYCYSEVVGDKVKDDDLNSISREILATRLRLSMDVTRPEVQVEKAEATPEGNIEVQFNINESGVVWCVAEDASGEKPLETLLKSNVKKEQGDYFKQYGVEMIVSENNPSTQTMVIPGIVANSVYNVYCYSEDDASPIPNIMGVCKVRSTKTTVVSLTKIPNVTIDRRITLQQGFMIFVTLDSPGRVWCIAAPDGYGVPAQDQVMTLGATADINDVSKSTSIELRGVEPNTIYNIYCMTARLSAAEPKIVEGTSSVDDMVSTSITATSFGAYCPMDDKVQTYFPMDVGSPFQPLSPKEELDVRSFILAQGLGFNGVYRISLYIDKDAFYNFYENGENAADLPPRYARVRSGTCVNNIGLYQQYVVGPIGGTTPMTYRLMTNPVETDCGGYLPAGVFGRRLMSVSSNESSDVESNFNDFLEESFGYSFHLDGCQDHSKCLELGPVMLEEVDGCVDDGKPCIKDAENSLSSEGRVWIGLKTPDGVRLPFWFIRKVEGTVKEKIDESPMEWAHRVIFNGAVPEEFEGIIESLEVWYDGKVYLNLAELLEDESKKLFTPESFKERLRQDQIEKMRAEKRKLAPSPYAGAAGTSGPVPQRVGKRGGLEYRPVPEHIESQGRRYVVQHSPGEDLFKISYIGWEMTVTTNRDTSLRINMISFKGQRVAFELGLMEALAHYTVSERNFFFLDSWYGGLGATARRVYRGIECPKTGMSLFYDGSLCVFEQDMARPARSHWKSGILRDGAPHVALVLRQMITVSNYDYITDFRFHNTGFIDASVSFTGELYAGIEVPWYSARQSAYGAQVTGAKRLAALHAHAVCWKVDIDVGADFRNNSLLLSHVKPDPLRNGANMIDKRFAETEMEAAVMRYDVRQLVYEVVDENIRIYDNYGGYRIIPSSGYNPQHYNYELFSGPAAWAKYKILSTVFKPYEYESSLPRDNKYSKRPAVSVDRYVSDNEDLRNVDIVTWVSDGVFHVPVIEDMPLTIPIGNTLSFLVKPSNMYLEDPSMDLYNAMGGGLNDPGTCGVVRYDIAEVEPSMNRVWNNTQYY